ncbi:type II toxin-antitoxin system VapC family toxin [Candidatus Bathyarchaeota archaeon]|nr:type II toxin-antitoxin system VapC family toxin [Candidatus Bathyarchaeota archaeon]
MIVLDIEVLIEILDKKSQKGSEILEKILDTDEKIGTTVINLHEVLCCLKKYAKLVEEVMRLPVLDYTKKDAVLAADIELKAEAKGTSIRKTDAMIAAIANNNKADLYTLDLKHFQPIKELGFLKLFSKNKAFQLNEYRQFLTNQRQGFF